MALWNLLLSAALVLASPEDDVRAMLARIDHMHQDLFDNVTAIFQWSTLFDNNGVWLFPIGLNETSTGPAEILAGLKPWIAQLSAERSYMLDISVAGNSGAFWWRDVYQSKANNCLFTCIGYNQFFINPATKLISYMTTWQDMDAGNIERTACGITPRPTYLDPNVPKMLQVILQTLSNKQNAANFVNDNFAETATWWEPVGVDSGKLSGKSAIAANWASAVASLSGWTSIALGDPTLVGNNGGIDIAVTFSKNANCSYSIREWISFSVDKAGLISSFDVYYDRASADAARSAC